jgi:hypothetical protein
MISENARVTVPNGTVFFGLSFKGDLDRWEAGIRDYCKQHRRKNGEIVSATFVLVDGESYPLEACTVQHYQGERT